MGKPNIVTAIDIGSANIKLLTAIKKQKEKEIETLFKTQISSMGVRRGIVINVNKVSEIITLLINKAEENCGEVINEVVVNVGGSHLFSKISRGLVSVSRADQKISEEDIQRVIQQSQAIALGSNQEIILVSPKEFIVDGQQGIKEPLGLKGTRLEVETVVVGGFGPYIKNLEEAISDANLSFSDLIPTPLASAYGVLEEREKELGVAVLDIGAGTTNLSVFEEGNLIHLAVFPMGSANITNDIAICLKIDIDLAEQIKLKFGHYLAQKNERKLQKKEKIMIEKKDSKEIISFNKKALVQIIEARVVEILKEVQKELKKIGKAHHLPAGVVLTGGGAKLPHLIELSKKHLKLPSRIGIPKGFSPELEDPSFATLVGLTINAFTKTREEKKDLLTFHKKLIKGIKKIFKFFIP